jgi:hypothetical protein
MCATTPLTYHPAIFPHISSISTAKTIPSNRGQSHSYPAATAATAATAANARSRDPNLAGKVSDSPSPFYGIFFSNRA